MNKKDEVQNLFQLVPTEKIGPVQLWALTCDSEVTIPGQPWSIIVKLTAGLVGEKLVHVPERSITALAIHLPKLLEQI